jgi:hypothetical protein
MASLIFHLYGYPPAKEVSVFPVDDKTEITQKPLNGKNYVFMPEICIMICCLIVKLEKVMTILVIFIEYPQRKTQTFE